MSEGRSGERDAGTDVLERPAEDGDAAVALTGHFYRGEMERVTTWRTRLDQTTNWAVVVMAAILTWAFSSPGNPHYVLLIGALAVGVFLLIEANRYQEYDAWRARVRLLQQNLMAAVYDSAGTDDVDWREQLSRDLQEPVVHLSLGRALGHRLQRVYFPLLSVLLAAWVLRITVFETESPWTQSAAIANIPGPAVVAVVGACYLALAVVTFQSLREAEKREFDSDTGTDRTRNDV